MDKMYADLASFPFEFTFGGKAIRGFGGMTKLGESKTVSRGKEETVTKFAFEPLEITLVSAYYPEYGAFEFRVDFENVSAHDSPLLSNPRVRMEFFGNVPILKGILGDIPNQYRPYAHDLTSMPVRFVSPTGRATHGNFPYFNLECGTGGALLAIGWAGTWNAEFTHKDGKTVYTASAVNNLNAYLKPGEKIRTALFCVLPYAVRNENHAMNLWRRWFINCNLPPFTADGAPMRPFSTCCIANDTGLPNSDGSISERSYTWRPTLEKMLAEDAKVDFRWVDAGWYIAPDGTSPESDWWGTVGTWTLDANKWPNGSFRESVDFAREHGMRTLMWFEPERVTDPENLAKHFGYNIDWAIRRPGGGTISNNIGNEACLQWTLDKITTTLRENRIDMYREDNNCNPAALWEYLDAREGQNRTGITESRFIANHYRMWDAIIECTKSYGGCAFTDSCASGGGRNDIESLRRGIPMLRSDSDRTTTALRLSMTTSFNRWIPFCGANTKEKKGQLDATGTSDAYTWRASYLPALNVDSQFTQDPNQDFDMLRFGLREWDRVKEYMLSDMYVLTPWHDECDRTGFTSYCWYDGEKQKGVLLIFRMEDCVLDTWKVNLPFAAENAKYTLTDADTNEVIIAGTQDIVLHLAEKRSARLLYIEKAN